MRSRAKAGLILSFVFLLLAACGGGYCYDCGYYDPWDPWYPWNPWDPWYPWYAQAATASDLDGDGLADLLTLDEGGREVLLAPGAAAPKPGDLSRRPMDAASGPCRLLPGHFDADGILDLAVFVEETGTFEVHLGNRDGTFAAATEAGRLVLGPDVASITCKGLDGDVLGDLLVQYADGRLAVYVADGAGGFVP